MPPTTTHKYSGARGYFLAVFDSLWTTLKGMMITLKYLNIFKEKPITLQYPDESPNILPGYRGKHVYVKAICIACRMCARACPVDCIAMDIEGKGKSAIVHSYKVDYTKCMFCNLCSETCPVDCLWLDTEFDLTQYAREACTMEMLDESNAALRMPEAAKIAKAPK
ncbi:MAG: 4Fe-4S binding protein [Candidatus Sumerlaeota bacterium]|nr:4Fe-4S binding protein [Candidatus Sumerlaeota bacterium]